MPLVVLNVVGLTPALLRHAPRMAGFADGDVTPLRPVFPAVTCSVQASMTTGKKPVAHGIVANGWYNRDEAEVRFWQRSRRLVQGEQLWDLAKHHDPNFTCANLFWWHNAYGGGDLEVQARPVYKADGRKIPDIYCNNAGWRDILQNELGRFPLFKFWGPMAGLESTRWIADATLHTHDHFSPTLTLSYLPHLDYDLQRLGPEHPGLFEQVAALDQVVGEMIDHFAAAGTRVVILSEYGVEATRRAPGGGSAAVYINRHLRQRGHLTVREEDGRDTLDPGASAAFAVADHQAAHVYLAPDTPPARAAEIEQACRTLDGVADTLRMNHARAGDFTLMAAPGRWFTYDFWLDPARAPDYARTVDIHRKPGYDPRELFADAGKAALGFKLARKKLGFRQLMDVIPLDPDLVRGTHGRTDLPPEHGPLLIGAGAGTDPLAVTAVFGQLSAALGVPCPT